MTDDVVERLLAVECPVSECDGIKGQWCSVYDEQGFQTSAFHDVRIRAALSPTPAEAPKEPIPAPPEPPRERRTCSLCDWAFCANPCPTCPDPAAFRAKKGG